MLKIISASDHTGFRRQVKLTQDYGQRLGRFPLLPRRILLLLLLLLDLPAHSLPELEKILRKVSELNPPRRDGHVVAVTARRLGLLRCRRDDVTAGSRSWTLLNTVGASCWVVGKCFDNIIFSHSKYTQITIL